MPANMQRQIQIMLQSEECIWLASDTINLGEGDLSCQDAASS